MSDVSMVLTCPDSSVTMHYHRINVPETGGDREELEQHSAVKIVLVFILFQTSIFVDIQEAPNGFQ